MTKRLFVLTNDRARVSAMDHIGNAPDGYQVTVEPPKRSTDQNSRLWAFLSDISEQVEWYGRKLDSESWKHVFTASLKKQDVVPALDGKGFVVLGVSTSKMGKGEFSDLMELMTAFGSERGVKWSEPE